MGQQHIKSLPCLILLQTNHHPFHEIDISPEGHLKTETISEGDVFSDGLEDGLVLGGDG